MATITKTQSAIFESNASLEQALARGMKFEFGTFTITGGSYTASSGVSMTLEFVNPILVLLPAVWDGYVLEYAITAGAAAGAVRVYYGNYDAADGPLIVVPTTCPTLTDVPYIAFGSS